MKYISILIIVILFSCNNNKESNSNILAEVYSNKLYVDEVIGLSKSQSAKDSSIFIKEFTDKWINEQLLLRKAKLYLTDEEKDISLLVNNYKKSLLLYRYESKYINKSLDTNITINDINEYYEKHKSEYILDKDIVKTSYIKLPNDTKKMWQLRSIYMSDKEEDLLKINKFVDDNNGEIIENNSWITFENMCNEISYTTTYATSVFLRYNKFFESHDTSNIFLIHVADYKLKNDTSPVDYLTKEISSILLNKRKMQLINELRNNVGNTANNNVKRYLK